MPAFQINDAEWSALVEEPGDVFLAYCSIRRFMDYETGIAGIRRRISEQMIREVLYVAPTRGRHESGSPTRQRVRSVIDRLITLEAIRPIGPMVYELPLASRDGLPKRSATDEQPHQQPHQQPIDNQTEASKDGAFSYEESASATTSETGDTANSNPPPVSGNLPTSRHRAREIADRFPMHDDWKPTPSGWKATALRNGLGAAQFTSELLMEFRSYWINRPDKYQSQGQWEHELAQKLKREVRNAQRPGSTQADANQERSASSRSGQQGARSAVDRVRANNAAAEAARQAAGEVVVEDGRNVRAPVDIELR